MNARAFKGIVDSRGNVIPLQSRRYDAGSTSARMSSWHTPTTDATNAISHPALIRNRAHDLVRNNPWAAKAVEVIVNNAVGYGIRAQLKSRSKARLARVQALWTAWAETTAIDADGMHDLYGLQRLAFRALVESGECLVRLRPRRTEDRLPVPMQIQMIESELLVDDVTDAVPDGHKIVRGIEFDAIGRRVAYYLYREHPGSGSINATQYTRVPATEILHLFRKDRPGQERGVTWLAPVVATLRELSIYEDAYLKRQQLANLFAGFLISNNPNAFEEELSDELPDLQPGTMYALPPGSSIEFTNPPPPGEDANYRDACLRRVAAGIGVTYESMTGDLSSVNFSSARMGAHEMGRNIDAWLWTLFIPRFCNGIFNWFLDAALMQGVPVGDIAAEWTPPARTVVDPNKEFSSLLTAVRAGFLSLPEAIRRQGYDPEAVAQEQADYLSILDQLGIQVESDYRHDGVAQAATGENVQQTDSVSADA